MVRRGPRPVRGAHDVPAVRPRASDARGRDPSRSRRRTTRCPGTGAPGTGARGPVRPFGVLPTSPSQKRPLRVRVRPYHRGVGAPAEHLQSTCRAWAHGPRGGTAMLNLQPTMLADVVSDRLTQLRQEADTERRLAAAREHSSPEPRPSSPWRRAIARLRLSAPRRSSPVRPRVPGATNRGPAGGEAAWLEERRP